MFRFNQVKELVSQYIHTHSLLLVISQFIHLGTSECATSIIGASVQLKARKKLMRKYSYVFDLSWSEVEPQPIICDKTLDVIWFFWYQGFDSAPELVHICYNSIKKYYPNKKIILLDKNNITEYVDLPDYIWKKFRNRKFSITHFSDILRVALLSRYGGTWIDSTVFCTGNEQSEKLFNRDFFVYRSLPPGNAGHCCYVSSWFITAKPCSKIIRQTYELLLEYWKNENSLLDYYLLHLFMCMAIEHNYEEWEKCPISDNGYPHLLQFSFNEIYDQVKYNEIRRLSNFHKLSNKFKPGFSAQLSKNLTFAKAFFAGMLS